MAPPTAVKAKPGLFQSTGVASDDDDDDHHHHRGGASSGPGLGGVRSSVRRACVCGSCSTREGYGRSPFCCGRSRHPMLCVGCSGPGSNASSHLPCSVCVVTILVRASRLPTWASPRRPGRVPEAGSAPSDLACCRVQFVQSLSRNRRLKSLVEIAGASLALAPALPHVCELSQTSFTDPMRIISLCTAFAVAVAADEPRPRNVNASQPPSPAKAYQAVAPRPPALGGGAEETDNQEAPDDNAVVAVHTSEGDAGAAGAANEGEGHSSFFLTGGSDLSSSRQPSVSVHVEGNTASAPLAHRPSEADAGAAAAAEEQKKESIANHIRWIRLLEKQALPWFNSIPDRDVIISTKAVRCAKAALHVRYLGWRSGLSIPLPVKITVKDVRIVDMAAMDLGGTSDPYCSIEMVGLKNTTNIQMETLSPVWEDLNYEYMVYEYANVMSITVKDWDEDTTDDLIGRCYIHAEDLLKEHDHVVTRTLFNDAGADQGQFSVRILCEHTPKNAETELLPSDYPESCAEQAGALARILWHLGVPRSKAAAIIEVVLRAEAPLRVIKRLGDVGVFSALQLCSRHWLVDFIGRWKLYTDFEQDKRERILRAKAPKLENTKNDWDERMRRLQQQAALTDKKVDVNKHLNVEIRPKGDRDENVKLALSFCDRPVLPVSDPEKAAKVVEDFLELYEDTHGGSALSDSLALDLIAEVLAKHERESRLVDQVDEVLDRVQKAVKDEQGPDGIGLLPNLELKKGMAHRWFKHKQEMDDKKKYMPMEYYLDPFITQHCKDIRGMRQAIVDLGHIFKTRVDAKSRKQVGPVILAIATVLRNKVTEIEEQLERKRKALGKLGAEMEAKKRQEQDETIAMVRKWHMLNDENLLPDLETEMMDLLAYYKANLMWSMSAAVAEERDTIVAKVLELRQSEIDRWQAEAEAAALAEEAARQRAEEIAASQQALEDAEAAGDAEEIARRKKEIAKLEGKPEADARPPRSGGSVLPPPRSGDSRPKSRAIGSAIVEGNASVAGVGAKSSKQRPAGNAPAAGGGQAKKIAAPDKKVVPAKGKPAAKKDTADDDGRSGDSGSISESESSESSSDDEADMKKSRATKAKGTVAKGDAKKKSGVLSAAAVPKGDAARDSNGKKSGIEASPPAVQASFPKPGNSKPTTKASDTKVPTIDSTTKENKDVLERQEIEHTPRIAALSSTQRASDPEEALNEENEQDETSSKTFLPSLPAKDAEDLKLTVQAALKEQIKVSQSSVPIRQQIKASKGPTERMMDSRTDPTVASELHQDHLMTIYNPRKDLAVLEEATEVSSVETTDQQLDAQDPQSSVQEWDDVADLLGSDDGALGDFGILELKGEGRGMLRNLIAKPVKEEKTVKEEKVELASTEQNQVQLVPSKPTPRERSEGQRPPVLKSIGGPHNLGGPIAKEDLPKMIYDAIMQVKRGRTARGPLESWKKALMTVVTWRERVFLVWKPKQSLLDRKAAEQNKLRPEDLHAQQMVRMTTSVFLQYVEGIQKIHAQNRSDPDDAKHRAMEKHKKRLAMSHAHLMQPSRSHLPFDFLAYCLSEDTMVFQKELNRDAKFVASFRWKKVLLVPEKEDSKLGAVSNDQGKLLSACVHGEEGVVHRLFTVWSDTWKLFCKTRDLIRSKAMQVPFYYRLGDTETLAEAQAVLVKSIIPVMDKRRVEEVMEVEAQGLLKKAESESFDCETNSGHALSNFDIDNILNYQGYSSMDSPQQQTNVLELEQDHMQQEIDKARTFLKTSRDNLRELVVQELALIQAMVRRCLRVRQVRKNLEKRMRRLAYNIADTAVDVCEISKIAFKSMVEDQLLDDGSLPGDSEAALMFRTKIPLERWAPSVGINWDEILDDADLVREQRNSNQVLAHESRRISDIIGEARRQLQIRCGWAGERKFVAKGPTIGHNVPVHLPHSYPDMEVTSGSNEFGAGYHRRGVLQYLPLPPAEKGTSVEFPNLGRQAYLHLSEKPAVANQIRIMRSRPRFQVKVKKRKDDDESDPHRHSISLSDVAGDRPGTFRSWGYGTAEQHIRDQQGLGLLSPLGLHSPLGLQSPPRTGYLGSARAGTGRGGLSRTGTGHLISRRGTAYSRVDFIEESDEEPDFLAEPSFSYAPAGAPSPRRGDDEDEEENHFTAALRQAARNAILERIAGQSTSFSSHLSLIIRLPSVLDFYLVCTNPDTRLCSLSQSCMQGHHHRSH